MFKRLLLKLTSVKTWIAIWSLWLISYIVVSDKPQFETLALSLLAVPTSYFVANTIQKHSTNNLEK